MSNYSHPIQSYYNVALTNSVKLVSVGPVNIHGFRFENNDAAAVFLQLFDKESVAQVTLGTTVPDRTYLVPANDGIVFLPLRVLNQFRNGLVIAACTSRSNATAAGAAASVEIFFSLA